MEQSRVSAILAGRQNAALARQGMTLLRATRYMAASKAIFDPLRRPTALETWPHRAPIRAVVVAVVIPGEPLSKQRPRAAYSADGMRMYTPKDTVQAESLIRSAVRVAHQQLLADGDMAFGVRLSFHAGTFQRRDVDNMTKLVFDACTGTIWADDSQVTELFARVIRGDAEARTEMLVYAVGLLGDRLKCPVCGRVRKQSPSTKARGFCSTRCAGVIRQALASRPCVVCGRDLREAGVTPSRGIRTCSAACAEELHSVAFVCTQCGVSSRRPRSTVRKGQRLFCGGDCADAWQLASRRGRLPGTCMVCGGGTSRKEYLHCVGCRKRKGNSRERSARSAA